MNEIWQLLVPLCSTIKNNIPNFVKVLDVKFDDTYGKYAISIGLQNVYPNTVKEIPGVSRVNVLDDGVEVIVICRPKYRKTFDLICDGLYSKIDKDIFNDVIAPTLTKNREIWTNIINKDIDTAKEYIAKKSSILNDDMLLDLAEAWLALDIELYKGLRK